MKKTALVVCPGRGTYNKPELGSISANIDAVRDVQHEVKRVEQKLVLDTVR